MKQKDWTEALRDRLKDAQIAPPAEGWKEPLPIPSPKGVHPSPRRSWGWVAAAAAAVLAVVVVVTSTDIFAPHKSGELAMIGESQQVNRSTGQQVNRATGQQVNESTSQQVNRSTGQQVNRSTGQQVNRSTGQQVNRSTGQQVNRSTGQQVNKSTGQQEISEELEIPKNLNDLAKLEEPKVQGGLAKRVKRTSQSPATASIASENLENSVSADQSNNSNHSKSSDKSTPPAAQPANAHSVQSSHSTPSTQSHAVQSSTLLADATPRHAARFRVPLTLGIRNAGANGGSTSVVPGSPVIAYNNTSSYYSSKPASAPSLRGVGGSSYVFNHNPEYSLGLTVAFEPIERFILESGLVWTTLSSQVVTTASTREQRIQYLGLPLYAGWRFVEHGAFSLIASAGATAERCLSASLGTWKQDERPWQFSVGAQMGIRYNLGHNFGLVFEPGVNYHLTETLLTTSRTDHPWSPTLRLTLQYTL